MPRQNLSSYFSLPISVRSVSRLLPRMVSYTSRYPLTTLAKTVKARFGCCIACISLMTMITLSRQVQMCNMCLTRGAAHTQGQSGHTQHPCEHHLAGERKKRSRMGRRCVLLHACPEGDCTNEVHRHGECVAL